MLETGRLMPVVWHSPPFLSGDWAAWRRYQSASAIRLCMRPKSSPVFSVVALPRSTKWAVMSRGSETEPSGLVLVALMHVCTLKARRSASALGCSLSMEYPF